ncbi:hypothetical protein KK120_18580 [Virgibacillus dakarensis]|nr:hypothetical protein [Virgibacillus dakarensis]
MDQLLDEIVKIVDRILRDKQIKGENRHVLVNGRLIDIVREIEILKRVVSNVADEYPDDTKYQELLQKLEVIESLDSRISELENNPTGGATPEQLEQLNKNKQDIESLQEENTQQRELISSLERRVSLLENYTMLDLAELINDINNLQAKNEEQEVVINDLKGRIQDLEDGSVTQAEINIITQNIAALQSDSDTQLDLIEEQDIRITSIEQEVDEHRVRIEALESNSGGGSGGDVDLSEVNRKIRNLENKNMIQDINLIKESLGRKIADQAIGFEAKPVQNFTDLVTDDLVNNANINHFEYCYYDGYTKTIAEQTGPSDRYQIGEKVTGNWGSNYFVQVESDGWSIYPALCELTNTFEFYKDNVKQELTGDTGFSTEKYDTFSCHVEENNTLLITRANWDNPEERIFILDLNTNVLTNISDLFDNTDYLTSLMGLFYIPHDDIYVGITWDGFITIDLNTNKIELDTNLDIYPSSTHMYWDKEDNSFYYFDSMNGEMNIVQYNDGISVSSFPVNNPNNYDLGNGFMYKIEDTFYLEFNANDPTYLYTISLQDFTLIRREKNNLYNFQIDGYLPSMYIKRPDPSNPDFVALNFVMVAGLRNATTTKQENYGYIKRLTDYQYDPEWSVGEWYVETEDIETTTPLDIVYSYVGYYTGTMGQFVGIQFSRDGGTTWSEPVPEETEVDISNQPEGYTLRVRMYFKYDAELAMYGFGGMPK